MKQRPKGPTAAHWRKKKFDALRLYPIPDDILPGSLSKSTVRCGKPTCHCLTGQGHPNWTLTFMYDGKKRVMHIPTDLVEQVQRAVDTGRAFKDAINDVMSANAELLLIGRKQLRDQRRRKQERKRRV